MKNRHSRNEKIQHWNNWKASGLTQSAYCQNKGLKQSSFKNWGKLLPGTALVPVAVLPDPVRENYRVHWGDCTIELPRDMQMSDWQQVLTALSEAKSC